MAASLILGLACLLCAKAARREEQKLRAEMAAFLSMCEIALPEGEGRITENTDLATLKTLEHLLIDLSKVHESKTKVPASFGVLEGLTDLEVTGQRTPEPSEDIRDCVSKEAEGALIKILTSAAHLPSLKRLTLLNMIINQLPIELFTTGQADIIIKLCEVACSKVAIPDETSLVQHILELSLDAFTCADNSFLPLLSMLNTLEILYIINSSIGDLCSKSIKRRLSLGKLKGLRIEKVEKKIFEDFIIYVDMELLETLIVTEVRLDEHLAFLGRRRRFRNLVKLILTSVGIKSIGGLRGKNFPRLNTLYLRGHLKLDLDKDMCRRELQGIRSLEMELVACEKNVDVGSFFPNLDTLVFTRGRVGLVKMGRVEECNEKKRIVLDMDMGIREREFEGLRVLHGSICKEIEVVIATNQQGMDQKQCKHLVNVVLGECKLLEILVLRFTPMQKFSSLEFLTNLKKGGGAFRHLNRFEVVGVDASCMMASLGMKWAKGGVSESEVRIRGTWNGRNKEWDLRGIPVDLKTGSS